jgi:multidrug efflux pump
MQLPEICIKRPVFATVLSLIILLIGLISYTRLSVREYPRIDEPVVSVSTTYRGASAEVVESQVTKPLEDSLAGIEGVELMTSQSRSERSQINVRFKLSRNPDSAAADVRDKVARVRGRLPDTVDEPVIAKVESDSQPIIYLAVQAGSLTPLEASDYVARYIKPRMSVLPGAADVRIFGERQVSMRINLDRTRLAGYRLTVQDVEDAIRRQNAEIPAGRIESQAREFTVVAETDLSTAEQFQSIVIANVGGYPVRIRDVGTAVVGAIDERTISRFNGQPSLNIGVIKQAVANPLELSNAVRAEVEKINPNLPQGMKLIVAYDTSVFIDRSIKSVFTTIGEATVLVLLIIFVFLRSLRATLVPLVTIPVSLIASFGLMYAFGFTINTLTLLAFVLAIGLVVDDAIVMLENIVRHVEHGMKPFDAALKGSKEIGFAIVAMTLTLAAVYVPLAFATGRTGKLFVEFALTLAGAVLVSGFTALTLSPMMASRMLQGEGENGHGAFYLAGERVLRAVDARYRSTLALALRAKAAVAVGAFVVFVAAVGLFLLLPQETAPKEDQGFLMAMGIAPQGATVAYTDKYAHQIEGMLMKLPDQQRVFQIVGFPDVTTTIGFTMLKDWDERTVNKSALKASNDLSGALFFGVPGVMAFSMTPPPLGSDDFLGKPVNVVVQSTGTWEELDATVRKLMAKMATNPNFQSVESDLKLDKPQLKLDVDRDKVAAVGTDVATVGHTLETLLGGRNVTRFKKGSEQYDVVVQVEDAARRTPGDLSNIFVRGGDGQMVQLSNLVTAQETIAAKQLNHFNKLRSAQVSAQLAPGYPLDKALKWMDQAIAEVAPGTPYDLAGQSREFRESSSDFVLIMLLAFGFIYLVLAAQFESWVDPLVILGGSVPLAFFGALLMLNIANFGSLHGWWDTTGSINVYTKIGLVTLVGLIAKHGILIVEFANQLQEQGRSKAEAVLEAAALRLRPILMTTGAMVLGALPLALASGAGAEARNQIGWVVVGGMSIGTVFTLFVVPVIYLLLGRVHKHAAEVAHPVVAETVPG